MIPVDERWWREYRSIDDVVVYQADVSEDDRREALAAHMLDEEESERSRTFIFPGPRRRFVFCRAALRSILCLRIGCSNGDLRFGTTDQNKPYALVRNEPIEFGFNVSHSGEYGLIAVGKPLLLGVDVEQRRQRRDFDLLISTVFSEEERNTISMVEAERKHDVFFDYWTVKEAVLKALGLGLSSVEPSLIEVPQELRAGQKSCLAEFPKISSAIWRIEDIGNVAFAAALAFKVD